MKICIICSEYPPGPIGGVGTCVLTAAEWYVAQGHQVKIIGVYYKDYPAPDFHVTNGVEVHRIRINPGKYTWIPARVKLYNQIAKWIKNKEVDIVEANDSYGWFALWGNVGAPLVIRANGTDTAFNNELGKKINRVTRFLEKGSYKRADDYCAASKYIAFENEKWFELEKKHTVIYNCIPSVPPQSYSEKRETDLVVFSGSLIAKKGVKELIQASLLLHTKNVKHRLVLNGKDYIEPTTGSTRKMLEEIVPENLKQYFIFNGHVTRETLYDYYKKATLAVFPSFVEAFAFAPMEAMVNGCPTIFTKRVSGPELINNGVNGILIEPSNIQEIADAIELLLSNKELAQKMGEAGREKIVSTFSSEVIMPQNLAFFEKVIAEYKRKNA